LCGREFEDVNLNQHSKTGFGLKTLFGLESGCEKERMDGYQKMKKGLC